MRFQGRNFEYQPAGGEDVGALKSSPVACRGPLRGFLMLPILPHLFSFSALLPLFSTVTFCPHLVTKMHIYSTFMFHFYYTTNIPLAARKWQEDPGSGVQEAQAFILPFKTLSGFVLSFCFPSSGKWGGGYIITQDLFQVGKSQC